MIRRLVKILSLDVMSLYGGFSCVGMPKCQVPSHAGKSADFLTPMAMGKLPLSLKQLIYFSIL